MNRLRSLGPVALSALLPLAVLAVAQYAPPDPVPVDADKLKAIGERTDKLDAAIKGLARQGVHDPVLADVRIYHDAAKNIVELNQFYNKDSAAWTLAVLDRGLLRASQAGRGESPWLAQPGLSSVRAYRSAVDGSLQPYAV